MDSSGRGEESTDAYRGVVLPSAHNQQPPTYGEQHVQPAGGSPWGAPAPQQTPGQPPQAAQPQTGQAGPPAADATQMLPPYPAGAPPLAPPGAAPAIPPGAAGQGQGEGPEATQVLRVQPAGPPPMPAAPAPGGPPAAEATQMLPPYPGGDPSLATGGGPAGAAPFPPGYDQGQPQQQPGQPTFEQAYGGGPAYPGQDQQPGRDFPGQDFPGQGFGGQEYPGPGYPGQDAPGGPGYGDPGAGGGFGGPQQQPPGPEHDSDYDHLFRHDVPSPAPMRPHIIQRPDPQQAQAQPQYQPQPPYAGQPGHAGHGSLPGGFDTSYDDGDGRRGGSRMSPKVIIGIVVAGCVVAGLVVGALLNGGGDASADNSPGKGGATASSTPDAGTGGSGGTAAADPGEQQAKELDALLQTSGDSRSQVISAVGSIKSCQDLDNAASDLRAAKTQRTGLVTKLGTLSLDKLPDNAALSDALTRAWKASAAADSHYASWAEQAKGKKVCKGGHARSTQETAAGNRESGTATEQKKRAVKLWNTIADKYGLTKRTYGQL